jgi:hypothetical protein
MPPTLGASSLSAKECEDMLLPFSKNEQVAFGLVDIILQFLFKGVEYRLCGGDC